MSDQYVAGEAQLNPTPPQTGDSGMTPASPPAIDWAGEFAKFSVRLGELEQAIAELRASTGGVSPGEVVQAVTMLHQRLAFLESIAGQYWREHFSNRAADHLPGASLGIAPPAPLQ